VRQFEKNKRYTSFGKYTLSDDEDISYEMTVHDKNYEAVFYQIPDTNKMDSLELQAQLKQELRKSYTEEEIENLTDDKKKEVAIKITMDILFKKSVWFRINKFDGEYYISMYYDNEYNKADGEDL
jgi:hypothetical protein